MQDEAKQKIADRRPKPTREERLADALRANLVRRKSLARAKKSRDATPPSATPPPSREHQS